MSTKLLETCRGFKYTYYRRNCPSSWSLTRIYTECLRRLRNSAQYERRKRERGNSTPYLQFKV